MSTGRMIQCGKTCDLPPGFGLSDAMATSVLSTDDCAHRLALLSPSAQPQSSDRVESRCTDIGRSSFDRTVRSELRFDVPPRASRGVVVYICFSFFLIRYRQLAARSGDCVLTVSVSLSLSETHLGRPSCARVPCGPRGAVRGIRSSILSAY